MVFLIFLQSGGGRFCGEKSKMFPEKGPSKVTKKYQKLTGND